MAALRNAAEQKPLHGGGPLWAVRVDGGPPVVRKCCDRSNGGM